MVFSKKVKQRYIQQPKHPLQKYNFFVLIKSKVLYTTMFRLHELMSFEVSSEVLQDQNQLILHFLKITKNLPLLSTKIFCGFRSLCKTFLP
jgi:hypothetical protein